MGKDTHLVYYLNGKKRTVRRNSAEGRKLKRYLDRQQALLDALTRPLEDGNAT
jgi:hypothetical protein